MNTTYSDGSFDKALADATLIQTALCYLMTRYTLRPCFGLVCTIVHHLQMLLAHPDMACLPERSKTYYELLQHWKTIAEHWRTSCRNEMASQYGALH